MMDTPLTAAEVQERKRWVQEAVRDGLLVALTSALQRWPMADTHTLAEAILAGRTEALSRALDYEGHGEALVGPGWQPLLHRQKSPERGDPVWVEAEDRRMLAGWCLNVKGWGDYLVLVGFAAGEAPPGSGRLDSTSTMKGDRLVQEHGLTRWAWYPSHRVHVGAR